MKRTEEWGQGRFPTGSILPLLRRIVQEFRIHGQKWNLPSNVGVTLMHLHLNPADSEPAALAEATYFPRQTMTFILDSMEKDGLAVRQPHANDRRRKVIALTPKGRKLAESMLQDLLQFEATALQAIAGTDMETLKTFLNRYAEGLATQNDRDSRS